MLKRSIAMIAVAATLSVPGLAMAAQGDPAVSEQVRTMLTEHGYEVRKIDFEDGLYEAYAIKDGKRMEILVNAQLEIVKGADSDD